MHEFSVAKVLVQRLRSWYRQQPKAPSVRAIRMRCGVSLSSEAFRQAFALSAAGTPFASTKLLIDPAKGLSAVEVIEVVCAEDTPARVRIVVRGAVQGVGFRPFAYRLATELGLAGWVRNDTGGVRIEVEGPRLRLEQFLLRLDQEAPPRAVIQGRESSWLDPAGYTTFRIRASRRPDKGRGPASSGGSRRRGQPTTTVLPDIAACPQCVRELFDPADRRFRYPFTNCTNCGPRYSIILSVPYDRPNTTMQGFVMCAACQREYEDPGDRRFHAQPNACPQCGPHVELWDGQGTVLALREEALVRAAAALCERAIIAVKGLGGFHLFVDARDHRAVERLRQRKHREEKPFAVMFPTLARVQETCELSMHETRLLQAPEAPIVLLHRRHGGILAPSVAPGNPLVGAMLPYTPLHHLILSDLGFPVVATSGNLSDEPICVDEREAVERLRGVADLWLVHNRPIARHVDDSVARTILGRELILRRARGYAPMPVECREPLPTVWAVGGHLKNTVAVARGHAIVVSQHIGDLETIQAYEAFRRVGASLRQLHDVQPVAVGCDAHPEYQSTRFARQSSLPAIPVQHHYAHVLACMVDNELASPVLGVAWDGSGYGTDGTIWGGEFLRVTDGAFERSAHWRTFALPGGEQAIREPRRAAIGLLDEMFGDEVWAMSDLPPVQAFRPQEQRVLAGMLRRAVNTPRTSSAGRLFDVAASLLDVRQTMTFEGQAAMELEGLLSGVSCETTYPVGFAGGIVDWEPMFRGMLEALKCGTLRAEIAAAFHNTLVEAIVTVARAIGEPRVVLTGGCFQNRYLTERAVDRLQATGFHPYWHQRIPPNDGGISVGQILAVQRALRGRPPRASRGALVDERGQ